MEFGRGSCGSFASVMHGLYEDWRLYTGCSSFWPGLAVLTVIYRCTSKPEQNPLLEAIQTHVSVLALLLLLLPLPAPPPPTTAARLLQLLLLLIMNHGILISSYIVITLIRCLWP